MLPKKRMPCHPGEILLYEYLKPQGISQRAFAKKIGVPIQRVNSLINGRRDMSPETAILLSQALGTTPEYWMALQSTRDLFVAKKKLGK